MQSFITANNIFTGHVLTNDKDESVSSIPDSIMKYSIQRAPNVNINASLTLLTTVDRSITQSDYAQLEESIDHVVWLVESIRVRRENLK